MDTNQLRQLFPEGQILVVARTDCPVKWYFLDDWNESWATENCPPFMKAFYASRGTELGTIVWMDDMLRTRAPNGKLIVPIVEIEDDFTTITETNV